MRTRKPWGYFEQFTENLESTVKLLFVKAGESLSLQSHQQRDEQWYILEGEGIVQINGDLHELLAGDNIYIKQGAKHRYAANQDSKILEVSTGHFDEDDIIRYDDKYGRK